MCLVCDRDLVGDGIQVPFIGEETTLPAGPATLALRSGAPLITAATYFDGRGHRFVIDPPVDTAREAGLRADVARVTGELAGAARNDHPHRARAVAPPAAQLAE